MDLWLEYFALLFRLGRSLASFDCMCYLLALILFIPFARFDSLGSLGVIFQLGRLLGLSLGSNPWILRLYLSLRTFAWILSLDHLLESFDLTFCLDL